MEKNDLGMLLGAFIIILVAVVLIDSIGNSIAAATTLDGTVNESITITAGAGTTTYADITSVSYFGNVSNNTNDDAAISIDTDLNYTKSSGAIVVGQNITPTDPELTIFADGSYNISYSYEPSEYVTDSTSRTLLKLVIIFFALGILAVGYLLVMRSFNNMGF